MPNPTDQMVVQDLSILLLDDADAYYAKLLQEVKLAGGKPVLVYFVAQWCDDCRANEENFTDWLNELPQQPYWEDVLRAYPDGKVPIVRAVASVNKHEDWKDPQGVPIYQTKAQGEYVLTDSMKKILRNPVMRNLNIFSIPAIAVLEYDAPTDSLIPVSMTQSTREGEPTPRQMNLQYGVLRKELVYAGALAEA